jgi:hypothetical protein
MSVRRIEDFVNERVGLITLGETLAGEELIHIYLYHPTFTEHQHTGITLSPSNCGRVGVIITKCR